MTDMSQTAASKTRTRPAAKGSRSKASNPSTNRANAKTRRADQDLVFKAEALDAVSTAIMMVDRELSITYMNTAAYTLMKGAQEAFRSVWPGFDPDALVGSCIDQFHRDPSHQRRLLDDPANLPHRADIEVAGLSFGLNVTAQITEAGEYVGCCLEWEDLTRLLEVNSKLEAVNRSQALIEFDLDGNIKTCNDNFLAATGYTLDELRGKHHRMFVDPAEAASPEYAAFWDRLREGQSIEGEFKRVDKAGKVLWLRASYNPVLDRGGKPVSFFKVASDITESKLRAWDLEAKMTAVDRGQAAIEFDLDGNVVDFNDNFQATMGYTLDEVRGRHHRTFVEAETAADPAYAAFWEQLGRGQFIEGEFRRITKSGDLVWLRASYNPVLGEDGKPVKFFKLASDITQEKHFRDQIEQILSQASQVMSAVSDGDLTQTIDGDYDGSLGQLQEATNTSIDNLAGLVSQIRDSASSMSGSAREVAEANQDLSRRTEGQASALEETAASMEEMTATVDQNADNARQASQLAVGAREQAQGGGEVVEQAVGAMGAISESSKKIADIIGVIDEIAFQTNLLALNAAVEAARAGDQGRGFAVVASEVRNLAQRSAEAAKEIKALIQDSLEKVEDGSKLVNKSGDQLTEIVTSVKKVSDIIAEIAAASEEQAAGINQVNQAVAEMDQSTQQNAAMVEEAAAASESMQQLSHSLLGLTEQFRIAGTAPATAAVAPAPVAAVAPARAPLANGPAAPIPEHAPDASSVDGDVWEDF